MRWRICVAAWAVSILALGTTGCCARMLQAASSCTNQIADCEGGRCLLATVDGKSQMVCERCKPNFVPSKDNLQCSKSYQQEFEDSFACLWLSDICVV